MRKLRTLKEAAKLRAKTPLLPARELFDGLLELKPSFASYLASNAEIVHPPAFESGAVTVLDKKTEMLTREERAALLPFKRSREAAAAQPPRVHKEGLADSILKRQNVVEQQVIHCFISVASVTIGDKTGQQQNGLYVLHKPLRCR
ncbi:hypothetical protein PI126_g14465 [Phytophthora idaei]|nr:hypothetical protein PI126_g14465 [Phytophthora idaei]